MVLNGFSLKMRCNKIKHVATQQHQREVSAISFFDFTPRLKKGKQRNKKTRI